MIITIAGNEFAWLTHLTQKVLMLTLKKFSQLLQKTKSSPKERFSF